MSELVPYAVHYLFDGVRQHFFKLAVHFSDVDAIHSASAHAYPESGRKIAEHATLEAARIKARQLGITQIRWNVSI
ncbi:DUF6555 family protein [Pseudomonas migulae]|uniref:Uncharacterized protein n=1 Tax=Pseudomonas migulae TaxID=78543 RepID=A0ABY8N1N3_9PSED|nr:DUF6555 family protein [Pseudomonas migulae]WGK92988.1 hypothetical protein MOQ58_12635 [Pseudomonas migulae]